MNDQQRIAHEFLGWTPHGADYWLVPAELDTSPLPGLQSGEPRRLPDLETPLGCAEWVELIKAELRQRDYNTRLNLTKLTATCALYDDGYVVAGGRELTELAALTAVVLELMENES